MCIGSDARGARGRVDSRFHSAPPKSGATCETSFGFSDAKFPRILSTSIIAIERSNRRNPRRRNVVSRTGSLVDAPDLGIARMASAGTASVRTRVGRRAAATGVLGAIGTKAARGIRDFRLEIARTARMGDRNEIVQRMAREISETDPKARMEALGATAMKAGVAIRVFVRAAVARGVIGVSRVEIETGMAGAGILASEVKSGMDVVKTDLAERIVGGSQILEARFVEGSTIVQRAVSRARRRVVRNRSPKVCKADLRETIRANRMEPTAS